jgi:hypothetical protein
MTRMGLSALVTIRLVNSSVDTSPIVSVGSRFVVPALTNSISKTRPDRRARSDAI